MAYQDQHLQIYKTLRNQQGFINIPKLIFDACIITQTQVNHKTGCDENAVFR